MWYILTETIVFFLLYKIPNLFNLFNCIVGTIGNKFILCAEAPEDAKSSKSCIFCSLHVNTGIAKV